MASASASAVPPQSFHLDRTLFNESLYTGIRDFWFAGLPPGSKTDNAIVRKRWWGAGRTEEESKAFDEECRERYGAALESIGPAKLALPVWESYSHDIEHAKEISAPFLNEIETAQKDDPTDVKATETLLSLLLLLDQMPRNIHRTPSGLRLIYTHYDRLASTLLHSSLPLTTHPYYRASPVYRNWFALPAMHAEDLAAQDLSISILTATMREAEEDGDMECAESVKQPIGFAERHRGIVERFGRFPHRNECLGRRHEGEEGEWLRDSGETFGVKQGQKGEGKSEL